jgi:cephalosporin hydroxylase
MTPPADTLPETVEGRVDRCSFALVAGWAWFPEQPSRAAVVEIVVDGAVVASGPAETHRIDLKLAGKRDGNCAFEISLEGVIAADAKASATVRVVGGGDLEGSPFELDPDLESARDASGQTLDDDTTALTGVPQTLGGDTGVVGYLEFCGPELVSGWAFDPDSGGGLPLAFYDGDTWVQDFEANHWRSHAEELRRGDGRCGFDFPIPDAIRDGQIHELDIRVRASGRSILGQPLRVRTEPLPVPEPIPEPPPPPPPPPPPSLLTRVRRLPRRLARGVRNRVRRALTPPPVVEPPAPPHVEFSFIVNFYNMRREAERTLRSLTRPYQHGVDDLHYEVLCIDNGSNPPLDEAWINSFGPEFRLVRPSQLLPSPCFAINEAARQAKGEYVAIIIDGAHVLTPGVFAETRAAIKEHPGTVVAMRHWFIGGDQRWLSSVGYSREMEDVLFDKINWPADGYEMFQIGVPLDENPNQWFNPMAESNCLFMPAELYQQIGGLDEAFSEPGGGFSNLDLLRRAANGGQESITCLVGEATFHQYHGGTTTNVSDEEKDARVRAYSTTYRDLRGEAFGNVDATRIRLRGRIRKPGAISTRHRPLFPATLGVTDRVRPGVVERHFDVGAQTYLDSTYAECGLHQTTTWLGEPVALAPADLISIQEIVNRVRPSRIVVTSQERGLIHFLDNVLCILGLDRTRIILVTLRADEGALPERVSTVVGEQCAPGTLAAVERLLEAEESVLVLFAPQPGDFRPIEALKAYARFVSFRSYLIYLRSVLGQPWLGYSRYWHLRAIQGFLNQGAPFVVDATWTQHLISSCPSGYLQRVKDLPLSTEYDAALDNIELL